MAENFNETFSRGGLPPAVDVEDAVAIADGKPTDDGYTDDDLLALWKVVKRACFEDFVSFERQWQRNIHYLLNRQWLVWSETDNRWKDIRVAKWIPRPTNPDLKNGLQAIRAMLTGIKSGVNARPNGSAAENVATAYVCDELHPLIHESHHMNAVMTEADWWTIVCGNAYGHTYVDYDPKYGIVEIPVERCVACDRSYTSDKIAEAGQVCPDCGGNQFKPDGVQKRPKGRPTTTALSPLELAFPNRYPRFEDIPYVVRKRWRGKTWFEGHPTLKTLATTLKFSKSSTDRNLQLFRSLATQNDIGLSPVYWNEGTGGANAEEGLPEYEVWYKPCDKYPKGLVFRVLGDSGEVIVHLEEDEGIPGPFPYTDAEGNPLFTFYHMGYEHVGGRVLASGAFDPAIPKLDQLNQWDSMYQMGFQRTANPVWLKPKGAEIQKMTGEPGMVIEWNPLVLDGKGKPERISGEGMHSSHFEMRNLIKKDIEEALGTFEIMKGGKPPGVESFAGLNLLVEQSQSRFSSLFQSRADFIKSWYSAAIELERIFGPDERTKAVLADSRSWTFQTFKRAQLQGAVTMVVEEGSTTPKTNLGIRAAVEHANTLQMLPLNDPDVQYEGLKLFGITKMVPTLDRHVQRALQKQQAFVEWLNTPQQQQESRAKDMQAQQDHQLKTRQALSVLPQPDAMGAIQPPVLPEPPSPLAHTPLAWKKWYSPRIHLQEWIKFCNGDRGVEVFRNFPFAEGLAEAHLMEIQIALTEEMMGPLGADTPQMGAPAGAAGAQNPKAAGRAQGTKNSNREATQDLEPSGQGEGAQRAGPR